MTKRNLGVAVVFLMGCATGGVSSQLVVPKASAQQATLTRWDYTCTEVRDADATKTLRPFGIEGWDLVTVTPGNQFTGDRYCFKRPKM